MGSRQAWRKAWWQVHKWLGLALMILFVPLGLSGVVLTWDDAIDHVLNPQRYAVHGPAALPPSAYAASARKALGEGGVVSQIRYPAEEGPVVIWSIPAGRTAGGPGRRIVWLDPGTARVLELRSGESGLVRVAHNFHGMLFIPGGAGRALIGLLGVAMTLMAVAGLWLWWPLIGRWLKGLRWQRGDRKLDTNLHHQLGFWIALPLAAQGFTGVWMSWPQMMAVAGLAPRAASMAPKAEARLTPDQALTAAQAITPGAPRLVAWPDGRGQWRMTVNGQDMRVDDATGVASLAPPNGLAMAMRHWHDGTTLGTPWRVVLILLGLAPTLLAVTGLTMWWRGRRWRRQAAARKARVREPVAAA